VAGLTTKTQRSQKVDPVAPSEGPHSAAFLSAIGREVRRHRAKRGMTRRQLAQASETSERYLAQIESGAGKSTLGRLVAQHLGWPFIELDRRVEEDYGASIPDLIEMAGTATFRRQERGALERVIAENDAAIITTAGGIVSNPETYALLLRHTHTIWIKARPEEHMSRVMAQGDFRPMAQNRQAMADLVAILDARRNDYARAEAELDTSGEAVGQSFAALLGIATTLVGERKP
jgi:XRE family transcriptional regulator, aerobic/anaerobic benzoate catabolism transcriptional regulator